LFAGNGQETAGASVASPVVAVDDIDEIMAAFVKGDEKQGSATLLLAYREHG
jgi:hypothetical protein